MSDAGFSGSGTEEDPYLISLLSVKADNNGVAAIIIQDTESFITISNCSIKSAYSGIIIKNAAEGSIKIFNNKIESTSGRGSGINFINTMSCRLENNSCNGFYTGLNLNKANENSILNNTITESRTCGINLIASSKNYITENIIQDAPEGGIATQSYSIANIIRKNRFLF